MRKRTEYLRNRSGHLYAEIKQRCGERMHYAISRENSASLAQTNRKFDDSRVGVGAGDLPKAGVLVMLNISARNSMFLLPTTCVFHERYVLIAVCRAAHRISR